jgi:hypothetical protein
MDVTILREACIAFRQIFMDLMGEDPFIKNATIAGLTMRLYRMLYLVDDDIPIVPEGGYNRHEMQSKEALRWLAWYSHSRKVPVRRCGSVWTDLIAARVFKSRTGTESTGISVQPLHHSRRTANTGRFWSFTVIIRLKVKQLLWLRMLLAWLRNVLPAAGTAGAQWQVV